MAKIKVSVDPELCIAAASCVGIAPKFFKLDEDNLANVVAANGDTAFTQILDITPEEKANLVEAAQSCPTTAILIEDAG